MKVDASLCLPGPTSYDSAGKEQNVEMAKEFNARWMQGPAIGYLKSIADAS
jgi:hypothetical protein